MNVYADTKQKNVANAVPVNASRQGTSLQDNRLSTIEQNGTIERISSGGRIGNPNGVVQRVIAVGTGFYNAAALRPLLRRSFTDGRIWDIVSKNVIPSLEQMSVSFPSEEALVYQLSAFALELLPFYNLTPGTSLAELITMQSEMQAFFLDHPELKHMVTTAGFEHEFADMYKGPLNGVSHLEIARSAETMPFTNIPFILETDAGNAVELVSPPFLVPTIGWAPLPDHRIVSVIDRIIRIALSGLTPVSDDKALVTGRPEKIQFSVFMARLQACTGLKFILTDLQLKPANISHNADFDRLARSVEVRSQDSASSSSSSSSPGSTLHLKHSVLEGIDFVKSHKGRNEPNQISSQLNFATDIATAQRLSTRSDVKGAAVYHALESRLTMLSSDVVLIQPAVGLFSSVMVRQLAGLLSVYSQNFIRQRQKEFYQIVVEGAERGGVVAALGDSEKHAFREHAGHSSYVKDSARIWVKDHLLSIASGILKTPEDYAEAIMLVGSMRAKVGTWESIGDISPDQWSVFLIELHRALDILRNYLETKESAIVNHNPGVDLYEHDSRFIGVRQDTFLDPLRVNHHRLRGENRLHVVEVRRGNVADFLQQHTPG